MPPLAHHNRHRVFTTNLRLGRYPTCLDSPNLLSQNLKLAQDPNSQAMVSLRKMEVRQPHVIYFEVLAS
jgi:hypothetical protein